MVGVCHEVALSIESTTTSRLELQRHGTCFFQQNCCSTVRHKKYVFILSIDLLRHFSLDLTGWKEVINDVAARIIHDNRMSS